MSSFYSNGILNKFRRHVYYTHIVNSQLQYVFGWYFPKKHYCCRGVPRPTQVRGHTYAFLCSISFVKLLRLFKEKAAKLFSLCRNVFPDFPSTELSVLGELLTALKHLFTLNAGTSCIFLLSSTTWSHSALPNKSK